MAIQFKILNDKLENAPLSEEELVKVKTVEEFVDGEILKQFNGGVIEVDLNKVDFTKSDTGWRNNIAPYRAQLMRNELEKRYKNAGWKISVRLDDGLDGPNRSGPDYWILTGKK